MRPRQYLPRKVDGFGFFGAKAKCFNEAAAVLAAESAHPDRPISGKIVGFNEAAAVLAAERSDAEGATSNATVASMRPRQYLPRKVMEIVQKKNRDARLQ